MLFCQWKNTPYLPSVVDDPVIGQGAPWPTPALFHAAEEEKPKNLKMM